MSAVLLGPVMKFTFAGRYAGADTPGCAGGIRAPSAANASNRSATTWLSPTTATCTGRNERRPARGLWTGRAYQRAGLGDRQADARNRRIHAEKRLVVRPRRHVDPRRLQRPTQHSGALRRQSGAELCRTRRAVLCLYVDRSGRQPAQEFDNRRSPTLRRDALRPCPRRLRRGEEALHDPALLGPRAPRSLRTSPQAALRAAAFPPVGRAPDS